MERLQDCDETAIDDGEAVIIQTPTRGGIWARQNSRD